MKLFVFRQYQFPEAQSTPWGSNDRIGHVLFYLAIEIVESFGPAFFKLRVARRKEAFHTITDFTLLHVLSRNSK